GRGIDPCFAVNVGAACVGGAAGSTTRGSGTQVAGARKFRISGNVTSSARGLRRRATVIQGAIGVIVRLVRCRIEVSYAVVQDTMVGSATGAVRLAIVQAVSRRIASERAVVQRAAICGAAVNGPVSCQHAIVKDRICRTAAPSKGIIYLSTT